MVIIAREITNIIVVAEESSSNLISTPLKNNSFFFNFSNYSTIYSLG